MKMVCTVKPANASITRNLYALSTAQLVLPPVEPQVKVRSFMRLFDRYGSAGVFRVSKARNAYGQKLELTLKHGLCVLEDDTVKVSEGKATGTAGQIIQALWSSPGVTQAPLYWRLGTLAETPTIEFEYSNPKLMDAVWEVLKKVPGYALDFDQSVFPWVLNLVKLGEQVSCEGRFGRNLDTCTVNVDDSAFCSRVYLDDRDGYTDSPTAAEWGIASTTLTVPEGADDAAVAEYVAAYLREYGEPRTTITLEAADMSTATGEELDAFSLGKVCRACLPDYNATVVQRIVTLATPEVYKDPDGVVVTMANRTETASSYLEKLRNNSKSLANQSTIINRRVGGAMAGIESNVIRLEKSETLLEDARLRMSYAGIIIDGEAASVKMLATLDVVEDTRQRMSKAGIDIDGAIANIKLFATQDVVDDTRERMSKAGIDIDGAAANVKLFATQEALDLKEESILQVTSDAISTKVSKDGVISSINQTAESIVISASKIDLSGYVTASQLSAEIADINLNIANTVSTDTLRASSAIIGYMTYADEYCTWKSKTVQTSVPDLLKSTITLANGNQMSVVTGWADAPSNYRSTLYYLSHN